MQIEVGLARGSAHRDGRAAGETAAAVVAAKAKLQEVQEAKATLEQSAKQVDCAEDAKEQRAATKATEAKQRADADTSKAKEEEEKVYSTL